VGNVYAIGISGRSGSGKSSLAGRICDGFHSSETVLIRQDSYYRNLEDIPFEERVTRNFDRPDAFDLPLLIEHAVGLKAGRTVGQPIYDFVEHRRSHEFLEISPARVLVLEGLLVFYPPELRDLLDLRIYLDGDDTLCFLRRIRRDVMERGRTYQSVLKQYEETVNPMYLKYVLPTKAWAHLILPDGWFDGPAVDAVRGIIKNVLRNG
jgi:uridine kinase